MDGNTPTLVTAGEWPYASAYSLLASRARLNIIDKGTAITLLGPRWQRGHMLAPWSVLDTPASAAALRLRPEELHCACSIDFWCPAPLRPWTGFQPWREIPLRFCLHCARYGYHTPVYQFRWWIRCPIHDTPLHETCPRCASAWSCGLPTDRLDRMLRCPRCGFDAVGLRAITGLEPAPFGAKQVLHDRMAEYLRWSRRVADRIVLWTSISGQAVRAERVLAEALRLASRDLPLSAPLERCLGCFQRVESNVVYRRFHTSSNATHCQSRRCSQRVWRVWDWTFLDREADGWLCMLPPPWSRLLPRLVYRLLRQLQARQIMGDLWPLAQVDPMTRELLFKFAPRAPESHVRLCLRLLRHFSIRHAGLMPLLDLNALASESPYSTWRGYENSGRWMAADPGDSVVGDVRSWLHSRQLVAVWEGLQISVRLGGSEAMYPYSFSQAACVVWQPVSNGSRAYYAVAGQERTKTQMFFPSVRADVSGRPADLANLEGGRD